MCRRRVQKQTRIFHQCSKLEVFPMCASTEFECTCVHMFWSNKQLGVNMHHFYSSTPLPSRSHHTTVAMLPGNGGCRYRAIIFAYACSCAAARRHPAWLRQLYFAYVNWWEALERRQYTNLNGDYPPIFTTAILKQVLILAHAKSIDVMRTISASRDISA